MKPLQEEKVRFQKQQSFQLVLISLKTSQGTFELKFLERSIRNSDLVNLLLAFDKERKEYSITVLSSRHLYSFWGDSEQGGSRGGRLQKSLPWNKVEMGLRSVQRNGESCQDDGFTLWPEERKKRWGGRRAGRPPQHRELWSLFWGCDLVSDVETCGHVLPANARHLERQCSLPHIPCHTGGTNGAVRNVCHQHFNCFTRKSVKASRGIEGRVGIAMHNQKSLIILRYYNVNVIRRGLTYVELTWVNEMINWRILFWRVDNLLALLYGTLYLIYIKYISILYIKYYPGTFLN